MANVKITELNIISSVASDDVIPIVDISTDSTNKITISSLTTKLLNDDLLTSNVQTVVSNMVSGNVETGVSADYDSVSKKINFAHADTSSLANTSINGNNFIQNLSFDTFGHVVGATASAIPVASTSIGGVKSGTDISVDASGNVSVNDNSHAHTISNVTNLQTSLDAKQSVLVSGTNIKTINGASILSSGNLLLASTNSPVFVSLNETSILTSGNVDCSLGNMFYITCSLITNFSFTNAPPAGNLYSFILEITNGGNYMVTWPSNVKFTGGSAPILTTDGVDILGFYTRDNGTTWRAVVISKDNR